MCHKMKKNKAAATLYWLHFTYTTIHMMNPLRHQVRHSPDMQLNRSFHFISVQPIIYLLFADWTCSYIDIFDHELYAIYGNNNDNNNKL